MQPDEMRTYIGASSIGNPCERAIWYGLNKPESKEVDPKLKLTFLIGKQLEWMLLDLLEKEINLCEPAITYQEPTYHLFMGKVDALILDKEDKPIAILEIKTANDSSFNTFKKKGVRLWYPEYYDQVQAYMGMSTIHTCYLLAINKNTSELHYEVVLFDADRYESLIAKAKRIGDSVIEPPRIHGSPNYFKCRMCFYKRICHE